MFVCSVLQRDACCCSGGWHGDCAGICAVTLGSVASAAWTSCWETLLLLPQLRWNQPVSFVLLPVTSAAGNSSRIGVLKSFVEGIPSKKKKRCAYRCALLRRWCDAAWGFLGAGRGFREGNPLDSSVPPLPSLMAKRQGLKSLIKRYGGMIMSGYLPEVRHVFLKGPMCFKPKLQLINLMVRIQKLDRFLLFLRNTKGIECERGVKSNVQSNSQKIGGRSCA